MTSSDGRRLSGQGTLNRPTMLLIEEEPWIRADLDPNSFHPGLAPIQGGIGRRSADGGYDQDVRCVHNLARAWLDQGKCFSRSGLLMFHPH